MDKILLVLISINGNVGTYPFPDFKQCEIAKKDLIKEIGKDRIRHIECTEMEMNNE